MAIKQDVPKELVSLLMEAFGYDAEVGAELQCL